MKAVVLHVAETIAILLFIETVLIWADIFGVGR